MDAKERKKKETKKAKLIKDRDYFRKMLDKRNKQISEISKELVVEPAHEWRKPQERKPVFLEALMAV